MARKVDTRQIGPFRYRVKQLRVRDSHEVLERIGNRLGKPIGELISGLGTKDLSKVAVGDLGAKQTGRAVAMLLEAFEGNDLNWLVDKIRPCVEYQTEQLAESRPDVFAKLEDWDDHFADKLPDEFKLIAFALELNYSSFFEGWGGLLQFAQRFVTPTQSK